MKIQYNPGKGSIRLLLFRRFLWVSVAAVLAIMSVSFVKTVYDTIIRNEMTSGIPSMRSDEIVLPELVLVPAGHFDMGEQGAAFIKNLGAEEKKYFGIPSKYVQIDRPFYISKNEITNEQCDSYVRAQKFSNQTTEKNSIILPVVKENENGKLPAVEINWRRAMAYAAGCRNAPGRNTAC